MQIARQNAYAKLNLTLDITGAEGGYHLIDSLVCTVDLCDKIVVKKRKDRRVNITMHGAFIPPEENNALRAGELFVSGFQTTGADITIYKNIPIGAGMGGSSADAAGVLNALAALYEVDDRHKIKELADMLGSDTGYLLTGGMARLTGRGEKVEPLPTPDLWFLALCPESGVSTAQCYAKYDEGRYSYTPRAQKAIDEFAKGNVSEGARYFHNALYEAASSLDPAVRDALIELKCFSPLGACMTGSGSACFALFENRDLCEWARSRYRGKCRSFVLHSVKA